MLKDVAFVCADSSRARCYAQAFRARDLLPSVFLLLPNAQAEKPRALPAPVKAPWGEYDPSLSVRNTCAEAGILCEDAPEHDINSPANVERIAAMPQKVFVYAGFGGVILRPELLACGKKFLHAHGGWLPDYKGSTTNYYSALQENFCAASVIFLNESIDQGEILRRRRFPVPADMSLMDYVHDNIFRAEALCDVLAMHKEEGGWPQPVAINEATEPYFVIHPLLRHLAILGHNGADWSCE